MTSRPPSASWDQQRFGDRRGAGRHQNAIERGGFRPALAIHRLRRPGRCRIRARAVDRRPAARGAGAARSRSRPPPAAPESPSDSPIRCRSRGRDRCGRRESSRHQGDHVRLRDRLALRRSAAAGLRRPGWRACGHELVARHLAHRRQDARVTDAARGDLLRRPSAPRGGSSIAHYALSRILPAGFGRTPQSAIPL